MPSCIKNEPALLGIWSIPCLGIGVAFQYLRCKLVDGEALVATMRKYCDLVCRTIVYIEQVTVLVFALANDD